LRSNAAFARLFKTVFNIFNPTTTGLTKLVMESYDFMISDIKTINADKLKEKIQRPGITLTREAIIRNGFERQKHHRGQTTIYMRLKGVTPPPEPFQ